MVGFLVSMAPGWQGTVVVFFSVNNSPKSQNKWKNSNNNPLLGSREPRFCNFFLDRWLLENDWALARNGHGRSCRCFSSLDLHACIFRRRWGMHGVPVFASSSVKKTQWAPIEPDGTKECGPKKWMTAVIHLDLMIQHSFLFTYFITQKHSLWQSETI